MRKCTDTVVILLLYKINKWTLRFEWLIANALLTGLQNASALENEQRHYEVFC